MITKWTFYVYALAFIPLVIQKKKKKDWKRFIVISGSLFEVYANQFSEKYANSQWKMFISVDPRQWLWPSAHVFRYSSRYNGQSGKIYTILFHATRWVMLYMKDKLEFFSPTQLQALDFVLLPWPNLHNERVNNMREQFERTSCFKCTIV